jgi:hypothetical protein
MVAERVAFDVTRTKVDYVWGVIHSALRTPQTWIMSGLTAFAVAVAAVLMSDDPDLARRLPFGVAVFAGMFVFYGAFFLLALLLAAMRNWGAPGAFAPIHYELSPTGVKVQAATGSGDTQWIVWKSYIETPGYLILRHKLNLVHIMPKRGLDAGVQQQIRDVLGANLRRPGS